MKTYDQPFRQTYTLPASAIATAGIKLRVVGPSGMQGRLASMSGVVTTATTDAVTVIQVGTTATATAYGVMTVAIGAADTFVNTFTDSTSDTNLIAADTTVEIASDGGATLGAADLVVTIDWF